MDVDIDARVWDLRGLREFGVTGLAGDTRARGALYIDWSGDGLELTFNGRGAGKSAAFEDVVVTGPYDSTVNLRMDPSGLVVSGEADASEMEVQGIQLAHVQAPWEVADSYEIFS